MLAAARFIGWWHETYPGQWIFVEPGLRRERSKHWMEPNDYPFVGSWQTIDNLFDQRAWRESPYQFGHAYLFPLQPRTLRVSLQVDL